MKIFQRRLNMKSLVAIESELVKMLDFHGLLDDLARCKARKTPYA